MRQEIAPDGQQIWASFEVINLVDGKVIDDQYGKDRARKLHKDHEDEFKDHGGPYTMKNRYGAPTHALNMNGMKALMQYSTSPFAMKFKKHYIEQGTRVDAGDPSLHSVLYANAASSNMYNVMARHQLPHQGASAGPSIAAPTDQVLAVCAVCFCCTFLDHSTPLTGRCGRRGRARREVQAQGR